MYTCAVYNRVGDPMAYSLEGLWPLGDWLFSNFQQVLKNLKYFNPLVSGPGFHLIKKLEVKFLLDCPFKV